ncbi:hypothetical protein ASF29_22795 [Rhizobium sp. Leaf262]|nr:hypothetical protein ASF29_22795 [Rhizobium sp. Leaf262]
MLPTGGPWALTTAETFFNVRRATFRFFTIQSLWLFWFECFDHEWVSFVAKAYSRFIRLEAIATQSLHRCFDFSGTRTIIWVFSRPMLTLSTTVQKCFDIVRQLDRRRRQDGCYPERKYHHVLPGILTFR